LHGHKAAANGLCDLALRQASPPKGENAQLLIIRQPRLSQPSCVASTALPISAALVLAFPAAMNRSSMADHHGKIAAFLEVALCAAFSPGWPVHAPALNRIADVLDDRPEVQMIEVMEHPDAVWDRPLRRFP
jgi:hypothetical protein